MRLVDAKSGEEARLPDESLHDFKGVLLRVLLSYLEQLSESSSFGAAAHRKNVILASGLVDGEHYTDWDDEHFAATMTRVLEAALLELRSWQCPSPHGQISSLGGFEAEIILRETPNESQPSRIPQACPQVLRILHLRGLWHFMVSADSFWNYDEAQEVLFVLQRAASRIPEVWKSAAEDLTRVCVSCATNSFLIWV